MSAILTTVPLKFVTVEYHEGESIVSRFDDGSHYGAHPHAEDCHYHVISHRLGYGDNLWLYAFEHEVAHHVWAEFMHDEPSHVIWSHANRMTLHNAKDALFEELGAQVLQRFARAGEEPIIADVDWHGMRAAFLRALA